MPLSNAALDMFVSQDLSKLTSCNIASLATEFPERSSWLNQFVLRRIVHNHISEENKAALTFILLRRAEAALDEWELACLAADELAAHEYENDKKPSGYFKILRHLEQCIASLWQALDFSCRACGIRIFEKNDGSPYERINKVYNVSRHYKPDELPTGDLHRVWLTNDAICTREHSVTFEEIRDALRMVGRIAQKLGGSIESG